MRFLFHSLAFRIVPLALRNHQHNIHHHRPSCVSMSAAASSSETQIETAHSWTIPINPVVVPEVQETIFNLAFKDDVIQGAKNMEHIFAIPHSHILQQLWMNPNPKPTKRVASWASTHRGSDVFVNRLGRFDINQVCQAVTKPRLAQLRQKLLDCVSDNAVKKLYSQYRPAQDKEMESGIIAATVAVTVEVMRDHLVNNCPEFYIDDLDFDEETHHVKNYLLDTVQTDFSWLVKLEDLQFEGYFGEHVRQHDSVLREDSRQHLRLLLNQDEECPARQHLIRYYKAWCMPENLARIDELAAVTATPLWGFKSMLKWPEDWATKNPRQLLNKMRHEHELCKIAPEKDWSYDHLDSLKDAGRIRVIRSDSSLGTTGLALKNCANDYRDRMFYNKCVIVTLQHASNADKSIAMGLIYVQRGDTHFDSIHESTNNAPSAENEQHFLDFLPSILEWHKKHNGDVNHENDEDSDEEEEEDDW